MPNLRANRRLIMRRRPVVAVGAAAPFALDGTPVAANTTGTSVGLNSFSTTYPAIVYIMQVGNGGAQITPSGGGLTWNLRASNLLAGSTIALYYAIAVSPVSANFTASQTSSDFMTALIFAFSGAAASPFDTNGSIPVAANGPTFSTDNANDIIIAGAVTNSTIDSPFTSLSASATTNFLGNGYRIVSATQSSQQAAWAGNSALNSVYDAIKQGP
jgi:hypothetical protein